MKRVAMHHRVKLLLRVTGIVSLFTQSVIAFNPGDGDSMNVRDSLGLHTSLGIRATISAFEIVMPKSNPLQNAESLDGTMIRIAKLTAEREKTPVTVPAHLILQTVEKNKTAIQSLYEKFLRRDRSLRGRLRWPSCSTSTASFDRSKSFKTRHKILCLRPN